MYDYIIYIYKDKGKGKGRFMGLSNTAAVRPVVFLPPTSSRFHLQRCHASDVRDLYQERRKLLPMNFASKSVIHENSLGSFTCRKAGTWDILFYFSSEGMHTEDFLDALKIQRFRPGLNPRTRVPVASILTTRPPKPSIIYIYIFFYLFVS